MSFYFPIGNSILKLTGSSAENNPNSFTIQCLYAVLAQSRDNKLDKEREGNNVTYFLLLRRNTEIY